MTNEPRIDFENIEQKLEAAMGTYEYGRLIDKIRIAKKIYIIGNGGLHFCAGHGATDMTRLIPGKAFYTFDSVGFITSNANDHGYDNLFTRWLEAMVQGVEDPGTTLILGLSCSGNSLNVVNALAWAKNDYLTFMISGRKSKVLAGGIHELVLDCKYFHTVEVLTLMLFYDIIEKMGNSCPTIAQEIQRKGQ